jgi:cephalosporin hydroxylase
MIGVDLFVKNRAILRALRRPTQRMVFVDGPSLSPTALGRVRQALGGAAFDVLLIDGDHSYGGALGDFLRYGEMVRDGGLIAFHDIVPDAYPQRGTSAAMSPVTMPPRAGVAWAGEVPRLWGVLSTFFEHETYIADCHQHGYGIGVLEYHCARVDDTLRSALTAATP